MAMLLILWGFISVALCLAVLGSAARPVPRVEEPATFDATVSSQRELGAVLQGASLASPASEGALPSSFQAG